MAFADLVAAKYHGLVLSDPVLQTLALRQPGDSTTPWAAGYGVPEGALHFEHGRALDRLQNLRHLLEDNLVAFTSFHNHPEDEQLSLEDFKFLVNLLRLYDRTLWEAAIAIMAVPLAPAIMDGYTGPADAVAFMAETLTRCPEIYPVCMGMTRDSLDLLLRGFLDNSHLRHMMFGEGGAFMYQQLQREVLSNNDLNFWWLRWILDIGKGLTKSVFADAKFLLDAIQAGVSDLATQFLDHKAGDFCFTDMPEQQKRIATRLALLLGFAAKNAAQLVLLKDYVLRAADPESQFAAFLPGGSHKTAIHGPSLCRNLLRKTGNVQSALDLALPIYNKAWELYKSTDQSVALSFYMIAQDPQLERIRSGEITAENVVLNEKMELVARAPAPTAFLASAVAAGSAVASAGHSF